METFCPVTNNRCSDGDCHVDGCKLSTQRLSMCVERDGELVPVCELANSLIGIGDAERAALMDDFYQRVDAAVMAFISEHSVGRTNAKFVEIVPTALNAVTGNFFAALMHSSLCGEKCNSRHDCPARRRADALCSALDATVATHFSQWMQI